MYLRSYGFYQCLIVVHIVTVQCRCDLSDEPIRTMCIGPSIPPCSCSETSCEVNNLYSYPIIVYA